MVDFTSLERYAVVITAKSRRGYRNFGCTQSVLHGIELACQTMFAEENPDYAPFRARIAFKHFRKIELRLGFANEIEQETFRASGKYQDLLFTLMHCSVKTKIRANGLVTKLPPVARTYHGYKVGRYFRRSITPLPIPADI